MANGEPFRSGFVGEGGVSLRAGLPFGEHFEFLVEQPG